METALMYDRLQFAFTISFHYLFPQLTMGLGLLIVYLKTRALRSGDEHYNDAARFWIKIFALSFAFGVASSVFILLNLAVAGWAYYPNMLISPTNPEYNLTIFNSATSPYAMQVGFYWFLLAITLITI